MKDFFRVNAALRLAGLAVGLLASSAVLSQTIRTVAGNGSYTASGDGGPATAAGMTPFDVVVDAAGNRFIADYYNHRVRKVTPAGVVTTVAGNGSYGDSGDGGLATSAQLSAVYHLALDSAGNLYLSDLGANRVRKVSANGIITTVAGNGVAGTSGDGGPATSASLNNPTGVALDAAGNLYIAGYDSRIRKVTPGGIITTYAGGGYGFSGDGGPAIDARFSYLWGIGFDRSGNLFVADYGNQRIRKIATTGIVSTVAGNGGFGFSGDGGPATSASLGYPLDIAFDSKGNGYVADYYNHRIRKIDTNGIISTVAGNGFPGFSGDGGAATAASLSYPSAVATDSGGYHLHVADSNNFRIRVVDLFTTCAAEGFTGAKLTLCHQICEVAQPASTLQGLVTLYMALYRTQPPCAQ